MNIYEIIALIVYFVAMLAIGIRMFVKNKSKSEKDYFLGGRNMGGVVSALSAGASDMSAWVLMGLPGVIALNGLSEIWISIGLLLGTICAWVFVAPRLRRFAIKAGDSITIPQFLSNRFMTKSKTLRIASAIVFVIGYCLYSASSIYACGRLVNMLIPKLSMDVGMIIMTIIIALYTLLGGFNAVCWTDFFQGMLMLIALMVVPIVAYVILQASGPIGAPLPDGSSNAIFGSLLKTGKFDWTSVSQILTGLGWGLGYFGMPHILVRYMAIKSEKEMKKSQKVGIGWIFIILTMTSLFGLIAHKFLGTLIVENGKDLVFAVTVRKIFGIGALALVGGVFIAAIVAASMSTADSQLLASSSAFSSDIYKTTIKKNASDKEMMWVGRIAVIVISIIALVIALCVYWFNIGSIMELVSAAWSIFGSAFGPAIILALFWRKFNYKGACAGIITGAVVSILWMVCFNLNYYGFNSLIANTSLYEIIPGFIISLLVAVITTKCTKEPEKEVLELFDSVGKQVD